MEVTELAYECVFKHILTGQELHVLVPDGESAVIAQSSYIGEDEFTVELCRSANKLGRIAHVMQLKYDQASLRLKSYSYNAIETLLFDCDYKLTNMSKTD